MVVMVHGVGANTNIPHDYNSDEQETAVLRKTALFDESTDDAIPGVSRKENWMGDLAGTLKSRGLLGHVVWYDFYEPWRSPVSVEGDSYYSTSLSRYLGDRSINNNPMGLEQPIYKYSYQGSEQHDTPGEYAEKECGGLGAITVAEGRSIGGDFVNLTGSAARQRANCLNNPTITKVGSGYFGNTAQTFWLKKKFRWEHASSNDVEYKGHTGPFLELAKEDYAQWHKLRYNQNDVPNEEVPKKFILIGHSMGGLTARDYITGSFYQGDVDKLITLDSPHEGSGIADYIELWHESSEDWEGENTALSGLVTSLKVGITTLELIDVCKYDAKKEPASWAGKWVAALTKGALTLKPFTMQGASAELATSLSEYHINEKITGNPHTRQGIRVLSTGIGGKNNDVLRPFNMRTDLDDPFGNDYNLPFFRLVYTDGVPTPGGLGVPHKQVTKPLQNIPAIAGFLWPYAFIDNYSDMSVFRSALGTSAGGYAGVQVASQLVDQWEPFSISSGIGAVAGATLGAMILDGEGGPERFTRIVHRLGTPLALQSFWYEMGSGFVPDYSAKADNVRIFSTTNADTKKYKIDYDFGKVNYIYAVKAIQMLWGFTLYKALEEAIPNNPIPLCARNIASYLLFSAGLESLLVSDANKADIANFLLESDLKALADYIGFHGSMAKRVDEDPASDAPSSGVGTDKKMIDELIWERPSVSIPYKPLDVFDYSRGGYIGFGTGEELVYISNTVSGSYMPVKWGEEEDVHIFNIDFEGMQTEDDIVTDEQKRARTLFIAGKKEGTVLRGIKVFSENAELYKDISALSECEVVTGFSVLEQGLQVDKDNEGLLKCDLGILIEEKGDYTLQVDAYHSDGDGALLINIGRAPGMAFIPAQLTRAKGNDWDRYLTLKNRRPQRINNVENPGPDDIDPSRAEQTDYHRTPLLVINSIPRLLNFEVDELQPDRLNEISFNFNFGTASISYAPVNDPNSFRKKPAHLTNQPLGLADPSQEDYKLTVELGGSTYSGIVKNPVDEWGKIILDFAKMEESLGIEEYSMQPFLEGRNHLRVYVENRWQMNRVQDINIFIPGPPPTVTPIFPLADESFCGSSKLEFETDLIYNISSGLKPEDISINYLSQDGQVHSISDFSIELASGSTTKYRVITNDDIDWALGLTGISIKVMPRIVGNSANPVNFNFEVRQDCIAPSVKFSENQVPVNPKHARYIVADKFLDGDEDRPVQDVLVELRTMDDERLSLLYAEQFSAPGIHAKELNWTINSIETNYPSGKYKLVIRTHDNTIKDNEADLARKLFWESYGESNNPDWTLPFADDCFEANCMTQWSKDEIEIILDTELPEILNVSYSPPADESGTIVYSGANLDQDLLMELTSRDNLSNEEYPLSAWFVLEQTDANGNKLNNDLDPLVYIFEDLEILESEGSEFGDFHFSHRILKKQDAEVRSLTGGAQVIAEGYYKLGGFVKDAAGNGRKIQDPNSNDNEILVGNSFFEKQLILDLTAPRILYANVPYSPTSSETHVISFEVDEANDVEMLRDGSLSTYIASANANCVGENSFSYSLAASSEIEGVAKYQMQALIPEDAAGECTVTIQVADSRGNVRRSSNVIVIDQLPPKIVSPTSGSDLVGRMAIKGSADDPSLNGGGSFAWYELSWIELDQDGELSGTWKHSGIEIPDAQKCSGTRLTNRSCKPVSVDAKSNVLGYWNIDAIPEESRDKVYRLRLVTSDAESALEDYVDVFVPASLPDVPEIELENSIPDILDFSQLEEVPISWSVDASSLSENYDVRLEISRMNSNNEVISTAINRLIEGVLPTVFKETPSESNNKGAYIWYDESDQTASVTTWRLKLAAGVEETNFNFSFQTEKETILRAELLDGSIPLEDVSVSEMPIEQGGKFLTFDVKIPANGSKEYKIISNDPSGMKLDLTNSTLEYEGGTYGAPDQTKIPFYAFNSLQSFVYLGASAHPVTQYNLLLPALNNGIDFVWDGKKGGSQAGVASGTYKIKATLENSDGSTSYSEKIVQVKSAPVQFTYADVTPDKVDFGTVLPDIQLSFSMDQDAMISVFVRSKEGGIPQDLQEVMKLELDGQLIPLNNYYLAGRSEPYRIRWDGRWGENLLLIPNTNGYEFVIQAKDPSSLELQNETTVPFDVVPSNMSPDPAMVELSVDGNTDEFIDQGGQNWQVARGMTDFLLGVRPSGKRVVNDNLNVDLLYRGNQLLPAKPFERYSVGVQIHKKSIEFWAVLAVGFLAGHEAEGDCEEDTAYTHTVKMLEDPLVIKETIPMNIFNININAGDRQHDMGGNMARSAAHLLLIPTYKLSRADVQSLIDETNSEPFAGKETVFKQLVLESSAEFKWFPSEHKSVFFKNGISGIESSGREPFETYYLSNPEGTSPSYNSSVLFWDRGCDVGKGNDKVCLPSENSIPDCSDGSEGCGNGIADEEEPVRGSPEGVHVGFDPEKHGSDFGIRAWAWKNTNGNNEEYNPGKEDLIDLKCLGGDGFRKSLRYRFEFYPREKFWAVPDGSGAGGDYGWNNLVNRYLTIDPLNPFLFGSSGPFKDNSTPFISAGSGPEIFQLKNPSSDPSALSDQYFLSLLHNFSFMQVKSQFNSTRRNGALAGDVEMYLHYFKINPSSRKYFPGIYTTKVQKGDEEIIVTGGENIAEGDIVSSPISLAFADESTPLSISIELEESSVPKPYPDQEVDWPLFALNESETSSCKKADQCGSDEDDVIVDVNDYYFLPSDQIETGFRKFTIPIQLGRLADGSCCGFDLSPWLKKEGEYFNRVQGEGTENEIEIYPDLADIDISITEMNSVRLPEGYSLDGNNIVRKNGIEGGHDYVSSDDPLFRDFDDDNDGLTSEDGVEDQIDEDGDLSIDEDPASYAKLRMQGVFPFVSGSASPILNSYPIADSLFANNLRQGVEPGNSTENGWSLLLSNGPQAFQDNPDLITKWDESSNPEEFQRTKLYYKDGKANTDVRFSQAKDMQNEDATKAILYIEPGDFDGTDRRLLQVKGSMPWQYGDSYQLFVSGEEGWQEINPVRSVPANMQQLKGTFGWWEVKTSGFHQVMLIRNTLSGVYYKVLPVLVSSGNFGNNTYSDELGRAQISLMSAPTFVDVVTLGADEIPQAVPGENVMGPVVKVYPPILMGEDELTVRLRYSRKEIQTNGWNQDASMYIYSYGYSPRRLDGIVWSFYLDDNTEVTSGANVGSSNWDYAVISGTISSSESIALEPAEFTVEIGDKNELVNLDGEMHSITVNSGSGESFELTVESEPQTKTMKLGESQYFDLNGDGELDIRVTLVSVVDGVASIRKESLSGIPRELGFFFAKQGRIETAVPILIQPHDKETILSEFVVKGLAEPGKALTAFQSTSDDFSTAIPVIDAVFTRDGADFQLSLQLNDGENYFWVSYQDAVGSKAKTSITKVQNTYSDFDVSLHPLGSSLLRKTALLVENAENENIKVVETIYGGLAAQSNVMPLEEKLLVENTFTDAIERSFHLEVNVGDLIVAKKTITIPVNELAPTITATDNLSSLIPDEQQFANMTFTDDLGVRWAWVQLYTSTGQLINSHWVEVGQLQSGSYRITMPNTEKLVLSVLDDYGSVVQSLDIPLPERDLLQGKIYSIRTGVTDISGNASLSLSYGLRGFLYEKNLMVPLVEASPDNDLYAYPLLLKFSQSQIDFSTVGLAGEDIRFLDQDGNIMESEIERWDQKNEIGEVWVKLPYVESGAEEIAFKMLWGNSDAQYPQNYGRVWNDGFQGVYHFNESWIGPRMPEGAQNGFAIYTSGDAIFAERVKLYGDLSVYGSLGIGDDGQVSGSGCYYLGYLPGNRVSFDPEICSSDLRQEIETGQAVLPGNHDVLLSGNSEMELLPGAYGALRVDPGNTIKLRSGVYHFYSVSLLQDSKIEADLKYGPIIVNVKSQWSVSERASVAVNGKTDASMVRWNFFGSDNVKFGNDISWKGVFTAPDAKIEFGDRVNWTGAIYAQSLSTRTDLTFTAELPKSRYASLPPDNAMFPPVNSDGFELFAKKLISIRNNTEISAKSGSMGDFVLGSDAKLIGDLWVWHDLTLGNQSEVSGDVFTGGNLQLGSNVKWQGVASPLTGENPYSMESISATSGEQEVIIENDQELTLIPGRYGNLTLRDRSKLRLQEGDYVFSNLTVGNDAHIYSNFQTTVTLAGDLRLNDRAKIHCGDDQQPSCIWLSSGNQVYLGNESIFRGLFKAPNAAVQTGRAFYYGTLQAKSITLGDGLKFYGGSGAATGGSNSEIPDYAVDTFWENDWLADVTRFRNHGESTGLITKSGHIGPSATTSDETKVIWPEAGYGAQNQGVLSFWINSPKTPGSIIQASPSSGNPWSITQDISGVMHFEFGNTIFQREISASTWVHFAIVWQGNTIRLYQNGLEVATSLTFSGVSIEQPQIVNSVSGLMLDELRFGQFAPNASWIRMDYETQKGGMVQNQEMEYHFAEGF